MDDWIPGFRRCQQIGACTSGSRVVRHRAMRVYTLRAKSGALVPFVRTARSERFDRLLILNQQHLERIVAVFSDHCGTVRSSDRRISRVTNTKRRFVWLAWLTAG